MNAADVLTEATGWGDTAEACVAVLLAHGEQGVAVLPDGTLRALEQRESGHWRLVPVSAEDAS